MARCGTAVLSDLFDAETLRSLRDELAQRKELQGSTPRLGHKLELPGVRGAQRQELVLPFRYSPAILEALRQPAAVALFQRMLGHPPAIDFVSLVLAFPGAEAQDFHRDAEAGTESALLIFVPLDETSVRGGAGPPEICPCTHWPGSAVRPRRAPNVQTIASLGLILSTAHVCMFWVAGGMHSQHRVRWGGSAGDGDR